MKIAAWFVGAILGVIVLWMLHAAGWERPPMETAQTGYRGLAMETVTNPRTAKAALANFSVPESLDPASPDGPRASEVYENVPVLGSLSQEQFDRIMLAVTEWVSPEQGCAYCHNEDNLASDEVYAKRVSARMFQMTAHINKEWKDHVGDTGVTCYTCHGGNPVPEDIWFADPGPPRVSGMVGFRDGQNVATAKVAFASLPFDPFSTFLKDETEIKVIPENALPRGDGVPLKDAEQTYALMMHVSQAVGENCTFCHNSRSFFAWDQSTPQRTTAWHGIRLVRRLNIDYMQPLTPEFPAERLGPLGDVAKVNCATCHQGVNKPLYGTNMLKDHPELDAAQ